MSKVGGQPFHFEVLIFLCSTMGVGTKDMYCFSDRICNHFYIHDSDWLSQSLQNLCTSEHKGLWA